MKTHKREILRIVWLFCCILAITPIFGATFIIPLPEKIIFDNTNASKDMFVDYAFRCTNVSGASWFKVPQYNQYSFNSNCGLNGIEFDYSFNSQSGDYALIWDGMDDKEQIIEDLNLQEPTQQLCSLQGMELHKSYIVSFKDVQTMTKDDKLMPFYYLYCTFKEIKQ